MEVRLGGTMRNQLHIKQELLDEILDLKADQFIERLKDVAMPTPHWNLLQDGYKSGFRDALIWLKEKGFNVGVIK